jgi:hypothetical protein
MTDVTTVSANPRSIPQLRNATETRLANSAPKAARYLENVALGELPGTQRRVDVAKFIVNHVVGTPRQKIEVNTETHVTVELKNFSTDELRMLLSNDGTAAMLPVAVPDADDDVVDVDAVIEEKNTQSTDDAPPTITDEMKLLWRDLQPSVDAPTTNDQTHTDATN